MLDGRCNGVTAAESALAMRLKKCFSMASPRAHFLVPLRFLVVKRYPVFNITSIRKRMAAKHNHRQRKKLRIGEFQEMGFSATARFLPDTSPAQREAILDAFIAFIEENGMLAAVSTSTDFDAFIISDAPRGSTTEEQRAAVQIWLSTQKCVTETAVAEMVDAWHASP